MSAVIRVWFCALMPACAPATCTLTLSPSSVVLPRQLTEPFVSVALSAPLLVRRLLVDPMAVVHVPCARLMLKPVAACRLVVPVRLRLPLPVLVTAMLPVCALMVVLPAVLRLPLIFICTDCPACTVVVPARPTCPCACIRTSRPAVKVLLPRPVRPPEPSVMDRSPTWA